MFTGIVTDVGRVRGVSRGGDLRLEIETTYDTASLDTGASIACAGACLTVVDKGADWFAVNASGETLARTTIGRWRPGTSANLERSLRVGEELGGHLVLGHVDGMAEVVGRAAEGDSLRFALLLPEALSRYIAPKGSVALDGVSLTVNEVAGGRFGVNIIPHTLRKTTFGALAVGDLVNVEVDVLARYVARLSTFTAR